ncbi:hypothetical protein FKM82_003722 [Ascaphus truei]
MYRGRQICSHNPFCMRCWAMAEKDLKVYSPCMVYLKISSLYNTIMYLIPPLVSPPPPPPPPHRLNPLSAMAVPAHCDHVNVVSLITETEKSSSSSVSMRARPRSSPTRSPIGKELKKIVHDIATQRVKRCCVPGK